MHGISGPQVVFRLYPIQDVALHGPCVAPTGIQDTLQYDLPQKEKKVKRIEKGKL